jgi:hypothetical protein
MKPNIIHPKSRILRFSFSLSLLTNIKAPAVRRERKKRDIRRGMMTNIAIMLRMRQVVPSQKQARKELTV